MQSSLIDLLLGAAIASALATFARPLPDEVGVGDAIQYDSNGDGAENLCADEAR